MELKVFTLNCWSIPVVSSNRKERIRAIATALALGSYDVVCLQEVWTDSDYFFIKKKVSGALPYSHYYYSGFLGSGVCVFSKHKIVKVHFHKWMINGYVHKIHHGDWFGGKGVALCVLKWNDFRIHIYSSHLHAEYDRKHDEYFPCRVVQAYETAQFIQLTSGDADAVILAGDLNTEPGDLPYRLMVNIPGLKDAYTESESKEKTSTVYSLTNTYTSNNLIKDQVPGPRIDYILSRGIGDVSVTQSGYAHPLPDKVPEKSFSYSDHEAITANLNISKTGGKNAPKQTDQKNDVIEAIDCMKTGLEKARCHKMFYWALTFILLCGFFGTFAADETLDIPMNFIRWLLTIVMCYTFTMAAIWNKLEVSAMHSAKLSMEVYLDSLG